MKPTKWKVKVYVIVTSAPEGFNQSQDEEEDEIVRRARLSEAGAETIEIETGIFDIATDPVMHLIPGCFVPKGKNNKRNYTTVIFESGNSVSAVGKPEDVQKDLDEFLKD